MTSEPQESNTTMLSLWWEMVGVTDATKKFGCLCNLLACHQIANTFWQFSYRRKEIQNKKENIWGLHIHIYQPLYAISKRMCIEQG